jgi:hypothetical protein
VNAETKVLERFARDDDDEEEDENEVEEMVEEEEAETMATECSYRLFGVGE